MSSRTGGDGLAVMEKDEWMSARISQLPSLWMMILAGVPIPL